MKLRDLLEQFDDLQRVRIVLGEEAVHGEACAMIKLLSEETLNLEVSTWKLNVQRLLILF